MFLGKEIEVLPLQDKLRSQTVTKYRPFLLPRAPDTPASSSTALHLLKACRKLIKLGCTHHAKFLIFKNFIQCIWFIFTPQFPPGTPYFYVPQVHVLLKTYNPMTPPCADHILLGGGPYTGVQLTSQEAQTWWKLSPLPQKPPAVHRSSVSGGAGKVLTEWWLIQDVGHRL